MNAKAIMAATINAIGKPLKAFGVLAVSSLTLIAENTTMISKKPIDVPTPLASEFKKLKP